jgi:glyceraldehyde 3-phosphate dehydrogenase
VNQAFKKASETTLKGILGYSTAPLVSVDFNGSTASSTLDAELTHVLEGTFFKVISWYDNESGFSARMLDLTEWMAKKD